MNQKEQYQKRIEEAAEEFLEKDSAAFYFEDYKEGFKAGAQFVLDNPPTPVVQDDEKLEPNLVHYKGDGEHSIYELEAIARQAVENEICYSLLIQELEAARSQQPDIEKVKALLSNEKYPLAARVEKALNCLYSYEVKPDVSELKEQNKKLIETLKKAQGAIKDLTKGRVSGGGNPHPVYELIYDTIMECTDRGIKK